MKNLVDFVLKILEGLQVLAPLKETRSDHCQGSALGGQSQVTPEHLADLGE